MGVSEHGFTDFGTRLLNTKKNGQRKMDPGAIVCEVTKSIVPAADQIRLLASAAEVHRRVCLFTVTGQQNMPGMKWTGQLN